MDIDRALWLTDTFDDHNGVSIVLQAMLQEIRQRDLPIDLLVCSHTIQPGDHLLVVKPVSEFSLPFYRQQPFRVPNYLAVNRIFKQGGYNRIISSTEGPMGMAALYLKRVWPVKSWFFLHTDWLAFAGKVLQWERGSQNRLQRLLRVYYRNFDGIFVLNSEQQQWLSGDLMGIDPEKVKMTAHWADPVFTRQEVTKTTVFGLQDEPVVLFAGRVSHEKGVFELPAIYRRTAEAIPNLRMVIAGTGPALEQLRTEFPEAIFTGWVEHDRLPSLFSAADMLILPSKFDTFSCVTLEALSCGLPVLAYDTKGPRDIIENAVSGFLVNTPEEMSDRLIGFFTEEQNRKKFAKASLDRARIYDKEIILERFLADMGLNRRA